MTAMTNPTAGNGGAPSKSVADLKLGSDSMCWRCGAPSVTAKGAPVCADCVEARAQRFRDRARRERLKRRPRITPIVGWWQR